MGTFPIILMPAAGCIQLTSCTIPVLLQHEVEMSSGEGQAYRMELDASDNDYYQWLSGNNVEINGVHSAFISDKGRGIVATRKLKVYPLTIIFKTPC